MTLALSSYMDRETRLAYVSLAEAVARGAQWLDERESGWADRIDTGRLVLTSPILCVAGQVFAERASLADVSEATGYRIMLNEAERTVSGAYPRFIGLDAWLGFTHPMRDLYDATSNSTGFAHPELQKLHALWIAEIEKRRTT